MVIRQYEHSRVTSVADLKALNQYEHSGTHSNQSLYSFSMSYPYMIVVAIGLLVGALVQLRASIYEYGCVCVLNKYVLDTYHTSTTTNNMV